MRGDLLKILFFTSILSGGGAERVLCQLANSFSELANVILVAAYKTPNEYELSNKIEKIYIDKNILEKNPMRQIFRLRDLIKKEQPNVCISFLPRPNFKMILSTIGLKSKVIISVRNDPNREYSSLIDKLQAFVLYPLADGIVFQTKMAQKYFSKKIQNNSVVIMNQVSRKFFETEHKTEEYWVATGRLNEQKNYPFLFRVFARFVQKYPNEILRIYGQGELQSELQDLINNLHMEKNIVLMGITNNVPDVLMRAKGFILSSDYEGMPNGLLEALAVGVPCISTDCPCGGPREVITDYMNGFLVPVNDEEVLYNRLVELETNLELRKNLAKNAKKYSDKFFSDKVFLQWKDYIIKVSRNEKGK